MPRASRAGAAVSRSLAGPATPSSTLLGMDIGALVFDVFGTVVDWRGGISREVRGLLGDRVDAVAFTDAWRARYRPSMDAVRRGERPWAVLDDLQRASLDDLQRESLDDLPVEFGVAADGPTRAELVRAWHRLDPWPDVLDGLGRLRV